VETIRPYRHSGRFSPASVAIIVSLGAIASFLLGFAYEEASRWASILSDIARLLVALAYGAIFAVGTTWLLKRFRVRNVPVAVATAVVIGLLALYGQWNAHVHGFLPDAALLVPPSEFWRVFADLYDKGSWSIEESGDPARGPFVALVWMVEAGVILFPVIKWPAELIRRTPFSEESQCWLDQEKSFDSLDEIIDLGALARLEAGDITPLLHARPRKPHSEKFARITLWYSPKCDKFCTMRVENIAMKEAENLALSADPKRHMKERKTALTPGLALPHAMRELVEKLATLEPPDLAKVPTRQAR
jgi:hypothetical protein